MDLAKGEESSNEEDTDSEIPEESDDSDCEDKMEHVANANETEVEEESDDSDSSDSEGEEEEGKEVAKYQESSSDSESDKCPVCLNRFLGQDLGSPETCNHMFCLECLLEWCKNINTCPIDRLVFRQICVRHDLGSSIIKKIKIKVPKKNDDGLPSEVITVCEVCSRGDREDRLLLCDACDLGYHCECLNPPLETVPIEEWYCPPCSNVMSRRSESVSHQQKRRVIARTRISEIVRLRIQLQRTVNSGSSASSSVRPRRMVRQIKRRKYRRRRKKTVKKRTTRARTKQSEAGKSAKKTKTQKKVTKKWRKKKVKRKIVQSKRSRLASRPLVAPSVKQRIADRLGLTKPPVGQTIPLLKKQPAPHLRKMRGAKNVMPSLFLFGEKDQLIKFDESVVETNSVGSTSSKNSSDAQQGSHSTAGISLLDAILENQNVLHKSYGNVVIGRDGSLNANTEDNLVASRIKKSSMSDKNKTISKAISSNISPVLHNQNILNLNSRTTASDSGDVYTKNVAHLNDGPKMTNQYQRKGKVAIKEKQVETAKHTALDQQNIFPKIQSTLRSAKFNGKINESSKWNLRNATRKKSDVEKPDERLVTTAERKKRKPSRESTEYNTLHNTSKDRSTAKSKITDVLEDAKAFSHMNKNIDSKTKFEQINSETDISDVNSSYNVPKEKYALNVDKSIKDLTPGEQKQKVSSELVKGSTLFKINSETVYVGKDGIYLKSVSNESSSENNISNRSCDRTLRISSDKGTVLSTDLSTTNSGLSVTSEIQLPKHNQNTINGQMHSMATGNIILQTSNCDKNNITHTNGFTSENEFSNSDTPLHILPENIVVGKDGSIYLKSSDVITCSNTGSQNYAEKFVGVAIDDINKLHDSENKTNSNYQNVVAEKFGFSFPSSNNNNGSLNQVSSNHNNFDNCKSLNSHLNNIFKENISKDSSSSCITSKNVILGKDGSIFLKYAELENAVSSTTCNESNFTPPACKEKNETENALKPIMTTAENILNRNVVEHSSKSTSSSLLECQNIVNFPVINKDNIWQVGTENSISDDHITSENIVVAEDGSIYRKATDNTDLVNTGSTTYKDSHFTSLLSKEKNATEEVLKPMITATGSSLSQNKVQHNSIISSNLLEHHKDINIPVIDKASTLQIGNESDISGNQMTSENIATMKDDPIYLKSTYNNADLKNTVSTSCKGIAFPPTLLNYPNETLENFHVVRKDSLCSVTSTDDSMLKANNIKLNHPTNNALKLKVKEQFICSETKSKKDQVCLQSPATASILKNNLSVDKDDCAIKSLKFFGSNELTSEALTTSSTNIKTMKNKKRICLNSERLIIGKDGSLCLTSSPNSCKRRKMHNSMLGTKTFSSMDCGTSHETKFSNKLKSVSINNAEMSTTQTTKYNSSYLETNKIVTSSFLDEGYTSSSSISIHDSANSNIVKQPRGPVVSLGHRTPEENEPKYSVRADDYNQNYAQEKPLDGQKSSCEKSKPCISSKMAKDSRKFELWNSIIAEVKKALKPFWQQRKITKEQYKEVMQRAVPKIWRNSQNGLDIVKINNLVQSYIVILESRAKNIKNS